MMIVYPITLAAHVARKTILTAWTDAELSPPYIRSAHSPMAGPVKLIKYGKT
jgi:hypothetical protein